MGWGGVEMGVGVGHPLVWDVEKPEGRPGGG